MKFEFGLQDWNFIELGTTIGFLEVFSFNSDHSKLLKQRIVQLLRGVTYNFNLQNYGRFSYEKNFVWISTIFKRKVLFEVIFLYEA